MRHLSKKALEELNAAYTASTQGTWYTRGCDSAILSQVADKPRKKDPAVIAVEPDGACGDPACCPQGEHLEISAIDRAFILSAHQCVPQLIDEILYWRKRCNKMKRKQCPP